MFKVKSLIAKLKDKHFLSLCGNGIMAIANMITLALLYRGLALPENGTWIFYQTAVLFVDTFRTGLLTTAVVKFYSGTTKERGEEVLGSTWILILLISAAFILLDLPFILLAGNLKDEGIRIFIKFLPANLLFSIPTVIALCKAQGEDRFDKILYVRAINNGLFLLAILFLWANNQLNLNSIILINLLTILLTGCFVLLSGWSGVKSISKWTASCVKSIFHYGKFTVATSISASLFKVTDSFIINFMLGPAALAVYNAGQRLMEIVEIPLRSFTATAMPVLSASYNQNNKDLFLSTLQKYVGVVTVALIPLLLISFVFADDAIGLIAGGKYQNTEAGNVFRLFVTFALLYPADRFLATALDAIHKPNINFYKVLGMLAINLIADLLGVHLIGNIYGIVMATLFTTLFAVAISNHYIKKNFNEYRFWRSYSWGLKAVIIKIINIIRGSGLKSAS
ncbi:Membrane protein involved in the export of O-antigen and teichoic acid [Cnuella takakiae]|uniref:Membrane protein involved in the export of O-antigen and teichoic acid n=2 Tax=Cnuella takakiae TaxID=1302690 RepID=A0A1M5CK27_9BACT|nr:Membrane protein involved in the export of O-antigen and teichoic acid [Cnuella takakiae]